jgi:AcrR family transcriptional regulator
MDANVKSPNVKSLVTDETLIKKRRAQIVAAAVNLFSKKGYYTTTIQEIAREAGVSIGLIYQYVHDKEDVLLLVLLSVLDSYKQELPAALDGVQDPLLRVWAVVGAYCRVVDARREATVLNYRSTKSLSAERRELIKTSELETNALISGCIQACVDDGLFQPVHVELLTYQVVMLAHAWALKHWRLKELCSLEQYIANGFSLLMAAVLTAKGRRRVHKVLPDLTALSPLLST